MCCPRAIAQHGRKAAAHALMRHEQGAYASLRSPSFASSVDQLFYCFLCF